MYAEDRTTIVDRREMLRVKLKSLAEESRLIRREERRTYGQLQQELHLHRTKNVRSAARSTHIAYALIKGRTMEQIEHPKSKEPDWTEIERLLKKYGPKDTGWVVPLKQAA